METDKKKQRNKIYDLTPMLISSGCTGQLFLEFFILWRVSALRDTLDDDPMRTALTFVASKSKV